MLFDALTDFYEKNGSKMQPTCHRLVEIDWLLELDGEGTFRGFTDQSDDGIEVIAPASMRAGNKVLAHLVVDNASYVLGYYKTASTAKKRCNDYREKVNAATERVGGKPLHALQKFLGSTHEIRKALVAAREEKIETTDDTILPVVNDTLLACKAGQSPSKLHHALHREWRRMFEEEYEAYVGECLSCGQTKPTLRVHERVSIFGSSYTSVANMNEAAFESHGLEKSANAPMCADCVSGYVQPLRYFSDTNRHQLRLRYDSDAGTATGWLTWLRVDAPDFDSGFMDQPEEGEALEALKSIWRSKSRKVKDNQFYAVSITVSDNRFSIRSFVARTLKKVIEKTEEYFDRQRLVRYGDEQTYSLLSLIKAAAPLVTNENTGRREPDREKLPPRFVDALVEHVLTGHALPASLRDRALRRCRAEQATTAENGEDGRRVDGAVPVHRAALLKLFLSQADGPMPTKALNREHPDRAYHCGRILAVADTVYHATKDTGNYISSRYYSSASTTPSTVIGRILPNLQHQLNKLKRDRGGYATNLDKELGQAMNEIGDGFPKILKPNRQALFALGFYHQRDALMTTSSDGDDSDGDGTDDDRA